ncbi:MAG: hypothetical protein WCJ25_01095 [Candidatus Moraniibacteriota bacterium]
MNRNEPTVTVTDKTSPETSGTVSRRPHDRFGKIRSMAPVAYALLIEASELSLLAFALFLTVDAILPGIISSRLNLASLFAAILLLIAVTATLGRHLGSTFPFTPDKKSPFTWIGISWLAFLLTLSTIRFPYWTIPIIIGSFFLAAHLFWKILFRKE